MKTQVLILSIALMLCFSVRPLCAQGGFGGISSKVDFSPYGPLLLFGGEGAWVINSSFYLGGGGFGTMNSLQIDDQQLSNLGYGGLKLGYFSKIKPRLRVGGELFSGGGGYVVDQLAYSLYLLEPTAKIWYSINRYAHLTMGLQYRFSFLDPDSPIQASDLSNPILKISIVFGVF